MSILAKLLRWSIPFLVFLSATSHVIPVDAASDDDSGPLDFITRKYSVLSPKGKFWTGAAIGFVSSRLILDATVSVIKIGGIAYIGYVLGFQS
jgi:hypothetical protein